jgi:hypothetical protein
LALGRTADAKQAVEQGLPVAKRAENAYALGVFASIAERITDDGAT